MVLLSFIKADTPNATKVVCTKQPVIKPTTVASPYGLPLVTLCISTYILSGPGEIARAEVAKTNDIKSS